MPWLLSASTAMMFAFGTVFSRTHCGSSRQKQSSAMPSVLSVIPASLSRNGNRARP